MLTKIALLISVFFFYDSGEVRGADLSMASVDVAKLVEGMNLTVGAKELFFRTNPEIVSDKSQFNKSCTDHQEPNRKVATTLGCYQEKNHSIFVYKISDHRLDGTMTVTAAHELLHAEYEKLGAGRRGKINILLAETFKHLADQDIRQRIGLYPEAQRLSEAHSILGTEVGNLPKDLETYYATYFLHRRGISQISERLKLESKKRAAEIDKYDSQLNKLKLKFENLRDEISKQERTIQDEKDDLDRLKDVGRIDEYNRLARSSNKRIADYNSEVHRAEKILNQFKELLAKRNSIAVETQEMAKALDSRVLSNSHKLEKTH